MRTSQKLTLASAALGLMISACSAKVETPDVMQIPALNTGDQQQVGQVHSGSGEPGFPSVLLGKTFRHYGEMDIQITSAGSEWIQIERNCRLGGGFCEVLGEMNHETFGLKLNDSTSTYFAHLTNNLKATTTATTTGNALTLNTHVVTSAGKASGNATHQISYQQKPCGSIGPGMEDKVTLRTYYPDGYSDEENCMPFYE